MRAHMRLVAVGLLAAVLTMGASGAALATVDAGDGELSKKEFIKAADDICRQGDQLSEELQAEVFAGLGPNDEPTPEQVEEFVAQLVPIIQQQHDAIEALPEPSADTKKIKKLLKALQKELDALEDDPQSGLNDDTPFPKSTKLARAYGLKVCGAN